MSNSKEKLNETALKELMLVIRRNSQDSACITNFENLLYEIDSPVFVNTTVNSMFNFLTEAFELFKAVDRVPQKKFKSKMLTTEFIDPLRFFGKVRQMANADMRVRAAIEYLEHKLSNATVDTERKPVRFDIETAEKIINQMWEFKELDANHKLVTVYKDWRWLFLNYQEDKIMQNHAEYLKELARKEMLVWNYIPAIIKAVLQTKRRSLDMDKNSKRFN
jgi:hypothetical protein